jgi:hypothetical protein
MKWVKSRKSINSSRLDKDICREIEGHLFKLILSPSDGAAVSEIPSLDYCAPSNEKGITILFGGDHGDQYFQFHAKIHLTSPMERKYCMSAQSFKSHAANAQKINTLF